MVSFPLKIIIVHEDGMKKKEMSEDDFFSFTFRSSNEKQYFIDNYEQINNDFKEFIEISKHDNELSAKSLSINENPIKKSNNNNDDTNNNNTNDNNNDDDENFEEEENDEINYKNEYKKMQT